MCGLTVLLRARLHIYVFSDGVSTSKIGSHATVVKRLPPESVVAIVLVLACHSIFTPIGVRYIYFNRRALHALGNRMERRPPAPQAQHSVVTGVDSPPVPRMERGCLALPKCSRC